MDALVAICLIVGTLAITTIAWMMIRAVKQFDTAAGEFRRTAEARGHRSPMHSRQAGNSSILPPDCGMWLRRSSVRPWPSRS